MTVAPVHRGLALSRPQFYHIPRAVPALGTLWACGYRPAVSTQGHSKEDRKTFQNTFRVTPSHNYQSQLSVSHCLQLSAPEKYKNSHPLHAILAQLPLSEPGSIGTKKQVGNYLQKWVWEHVVTQKGSVILVYSDCTELYHCCALPPDMGEKQRGLQCHDPRCACAVHPHHTLSPDTGKGNRVPEQK